MNMIDVIDEIFTKMGVPKEELNKVRLEATALFVQTAEDKDRITRELSEEEVERFRQLGALYIMTVLLDPEFRKKLKDHIGNQIKNN